MLCVVCALAYACVACTLCVLITRITPTENGLYLFARDKTSALIGYKPYVSSISTYTQSTSSAPIFHFFNSHVWVSPVMSRYLYHAMSSVFSFYTFEKHTHKHFFCVWKCTQEIPTTLKKDLVFTHAYFVLKKEKERKEEGALKKMSFLSYKPYKGIY